MILNQMAPTARGYLSAMPKDHKRKRRSAPPKLLKRYTFQEPSANAYAVDFFFDYDVAGEAVLIPTTGHIELPGPLNF